MDITNDVFTMTFNRFPNLKDCTNYADKLGYTCIIQDEATGDYSTTSNYTFVPLLQIRLGIIACYIAYIKKEGFWVTQPRSQS